MRQSFASAEAAFPKQMQPQEHAELRAEGLQTLRAHCNDVGTILSIMAFTVQLELPEPRSFSRSRRSILAVLPVRTIKKSPADEQQGSFFSVV